MVDLDAYPPAPPRPQLRRSGLLSGEAVPDIEGLQVLVHLGYQLGAPGLVPADAPAALARVPALLDVHVHRRGVPVEPQLDQPLRYRWVGLNVAPPDLASGHGARRVKVSPHRMLR